MNNNSVIELTQTDIIRIIHKVPELHTDLAYYFIDRVKEELGIDVVAVYGQNYTQLVLDEPVPDKKRSLFQKKMPFPQHHFEKKIDITVYVRNEIGQPKPFVVEYEVGKMMAKIFDELLESKRMELDFPRSFIPEEMDLYGFNPKKPAAWDISRIRHPEGEVQKTTSVRIEAFDSLAMWHIMNDSMYMISNINRLKNKLLAKVKFEFDPSTNEYNHVVTVPSDVALDVIKDEFYNKDLHDRMYGIVTKYDKWGVLTKEKYIPSFITANEATQRAKNAR